MQKMKKDMVPFYALQFVLSLVTTWVLAHYIAYWSAEASAYYVALFVLIGFIWPTQVAGVIWGNTERKYWLTQISIMMGNMLVGFMAAAFVLSF